MALSQNLKIGAAALGFVLLFSVGCCAGLYFWAAGSTPEGLVEGSYGTRALARDIAEPNTAEVHLWLDERRLLLTTRTEILIFDTATDQVAARVADDGEERGEPSVRCVTPMGGVFSFYRVTRSGGGVSSTLTGDVRVPDFAEPNVFGEVEPHVDRFTCEVRPNGSRPGRGSVTPYVAVDQQHEHSVEEEAPEEARCMVHEQLGGAIEVNNDRLGSSRALAPSFDRRAGNYLWYGDLSFDSEPDDWFLRTWEFDGTGVLSRELDLPAGPWVYPHSIGKQLGCFSCGCACYEHLEIQKANGRIFIFVWGREVEPEHQGIYEWQEPGAGSPRGSWELIASRVDDAGFAVSPDGCQVAYRSGGGLTVADVCDVPSQPRQ